MVNRLCAARTDAKINGINTIMKIIVKLIAFSDYLNLFYKIRENLLLNTLYFF
jgi:hypothetical protein